MEITIRPYDESSVHVGNNYCVYLFQLDLDSNYTAASGGYALPNNILPFEQHFGIFSGVYFANTQGYTIEYNSTTRKIIVYLGAGLEVVDGGNLSGVTNICGRAEGWR